MRWNYEKCVCIFSLTHVDAYTYLIKVIIGLSLEQWAGLLCWDFDRPKIIAPRLAVRYQMGCLLESALTLNY